MAKKKIELKDLGKPKEHLLRQFPFLRKEFRKIDKKDLNNKETFTELFGNVDYQPHFIKAIHEYQK